MHALACEVEAEELCQHLHLEMTQASAPVVGLLEWLELMESEALTAHSRSKEVQSGAEVECALPAGMVTKGYGNGDLLQANGEKVSSLTPLMETSLENRVCSESTAVSRA